MTTTTTISSVEITTAIQWFRITDIDFDMFAIICEQYQLSVSFVVYC